MLIKGGSDFLLLLEFRILVFLYEQKIGLDDSHS